MAHSHQILKGSPGVPPVGWARRHWREVLSLTLVLALLGGAWWLRRPLHQFPLERDEGAYAVIAGRWFAGAALYRDLFDHKPPFVYVIYGLAPHFAGEPVLAVRTLATVYLMLVGAAMAALTWRLYGKIAALSGLLLALVYSSSRTFQGLTFNSEAIMALPAARFVYDYPVERLPGGHEQLLSALRAALPPLIITYHDIQPAGFYPFMSDYGYTLRTTIGGYDIYERAPSEPRTKNRELRIEDRR